VDCEHENYQSPLSTRYAGKAMRFNFSARKKFTTWRRLWIALAECQKELGLSITDGQLDELRAHIDGIDFERAANYERELRHDVMAHLHTFADAAPSARPILHLGATSCYVTDNAELIVLRDALALVKQDLVGVMRALRDFAERWKALPVLGSTHYQPAQGTTLGKRACLWLQDLYFNLVDLEHIEKQVFFRGVKGTTGSQSSFLQLFEGDHEKVRELDRRVTARMGFERTFAVTGQTYPRQLDFRITQVLSAIAQSAAKFAVDVRLSSGRRELSEPFEEKQIGSSAMPWKRNPMRCERIGALSRHVITLLASTAHTAANQWFERTLDDSANRRLTLAEMFLGADAILSLYANVASGLCVHEAVFEAHLAEEIPFLASEMLLMEVVKTGVDRQVAHEALRQLSGEAGAAIHAGKPNPLRARLAEHPLFAPLKDRFGELFDPLRFVGRAPEQVDDYLRDEIDPLLEVHRGLARIESEIRV
jgi:adenylosuccinate lyase